MQVQIWNSFSCNNSSDYRLVARFNDPVVASKMGTKLREFFTAYGGEFDDYCEKHDYTIPSKVSLPAADALAKELDFQWNPGDILSWGDEGLRDNEPAIEVVGSTLAIYHDYCGGFTDNIVNALTKAGAAVEPEDRCPPEISARFVLPDGADGEAMAGALATFLDQKATKELYEFSPAPWGEHRLSGDQDSIFWYRDGQRFAFKMPLPPAGIALLKSYLANVRDLDLRMCDAKELAGFEMRDVLAELDAKLASGRAIEELDLSSRRLHYVPEQIFRMTALRKLVLDENALGELPESFASLAALEELHVSSCELTTLPDALAQLPKLRVLDLSRNQFQVIPPVLARMPALRELSLDMLPNGAVVAGLAQLSALESLSLTFLRAEGSDLRPFPREVLGLRKLRSLDVSSSAFDGIPDELADLTELETLKLEGVLGHNKRLPPLHKLPKLTTLLISGGASNTGKYAPHAVLDGVWAITTLHTLGIDRYGLEKNERPEHPGLPDDAFARMPHLRVLDVSFNELTTLPSSFYALKELESVNLRYTKLDRPTLDKLQTTFPRVRLDLRNVDTKVDVDDPHWQAVHTKVKQGASKLSRDRAGAVAELEEAIAMCRTGAMYSDYDELYATYGCVDALGHLRVAAQGDEREKLGDRLIAHATRALELAPAPGTIWHFTNEGAFQEEVTRKAGNALAWMLMERGDTDGALHVVERALSVGGERNYIFDTKVRILLKAGRSAEAYPIVESILAGDPSFGDFQDIKASPEYAAWRSTRGS